MFVRHYPRAEPTGVRQPGDAADALPRALALVTAPRQLARVQERCKTRADGVEIFRASELVMPVLIVGLSCRVEG
jgi:hypothetical protein